MPVVTVYRHGVTAGVPPLKNDHQRALRDVIGGWSEGATRRNTRFLYSIREDQLDGRGYAVTLTLRDCPPDSETWHRYRRAWEKRMVRAGMIRLHWVTEWQRRGVPHLHGAIWFPESMPERHARDLIRYSWMDVAEASGVGLRGQHVHPITGVVGWFQYLAKHAARGVKHYQRSRDNMPEAWQERTGRMWGKGGQWPTREAVRIDLQGRDGDRGYYAFRRMVRAWRVADARAAGDIHRLRSARSMLACNDRPLSELRGVSEWVSEPMTLAMLANLAARGFAVQG